MLRNIASTGKLGIPASFSGSVPGLVTVKVADTGVAPFYIKYDATSNWWDFVALA
jgi:hypothetical protein